jgi:hypothetical protein
MMMMIDDIAILLNSLNIKSIFTLFAINHDICSMKLSNTVASLVLQVPSTTVTILVYLLKNVSQTQAEPLLPFTHS